MLDGIVIEGTFIEERAVPMLAEVKSGFIKRNYLVILVSIAVHMLFAMVFLLLSEKHQVQATKTTKKAIKSYLYQTPVKPVAKPTVKEVPKKAEKAVVLKQDNNAQQLNNKQESEAKVEVRENDSQENTSTVEKTAASTKPQAAVPSTFSAYKQLDNLRNSINKQIMAEAVAQYQQFRSASLMHGEQIPVPHSSYQLTPDQKREKNTERMSDAISITKYDNGLCVIERTQFLGSPVLGSSAAFTCGESKFDKNFREHMNKVQAKLSTNPQK